MKSKTFWLATSALAAAVVWAVPLDAGAKERKPTLEERVKALEEQQQQTQEQQADQRTRITNIEQNAADTVWKFSNGRPTVTSGDKRFSLSLRGRFHFDFASFMQDDNLPPAVTARDLSSGAVVRRAQIGVEGKAFKDFWYEMRFNFGGSDTETAAEAVNIMRVAYNPDPDFRINVGVMQPVFTYADAVSSNEITFMERATIINTLVDPFGGSDGRRGVELTYQHSGLLTSSDNIVITTAFTGQRTGSARAGDEGTQWLGRIAYRLWSDGASNVQIGATGATILNLQSVGPAASTVVQFRDRPEIRVDGTRLVDTGTSLGSMAADGGWMYGFEAGANFDNFYVGGEYYQFGLERDHFFAPAPGDPEFDGWYVEGSWILTGEPKSYSPKSSSNQYGVWGNPKVVTPFSLDGNSWGAWEIAVRYSTIDLNWNEGLAGFATPAGGVRGGEEEIWTFGVNWYLNNQIRVMFNFLDIDVDRLNGAGVQIGQELQVVGSRVQFAF